MLLLLEGKTHPAQGCFGISLLFRIVGTTWPAAVLPGLLAAGISFFLGRYDDIDLVIRDRDRYVAGSEEMEVRCWEVRVCMPWFWSKPKQNNFLNIWEKRTIPW